DAMGKLVDGLRDAMANAFSFNPSAFENAFQAAMDMDELSNLMMSMYYTEESSSEANLHKFGYADYERPSTITIYPLDFEAKKRVKTIIDDYNTMQKDAGDDDKVIVYTDAVDMLMGSVTDIIKVVRDVLIAFVSISLVVSSVMIGVITYISVLERQKEIGILRAIGASKGNISQVFNAETFITGALAGLLGVGITLAAIPPINAIIHNLTGQYNINAALPLTSAGVLVLLSIVLTLLGGIIPSMKAAKSDPVSALRSE
ncbi:MAG: ABC transporter permease, partial [Clostridia bacterium]|nr:ABC transporter permease [Clostridia bacterium]